MGFFAKLLTHTKQSVTPLKHKEQYDPLNLFTAPDVPPPGAAPLTPDMDPAAQAARDEAQLRERKSQLRARGRASTIATGGQGDLSVASTARRTLLGS